MKNVGTPYTLYFGRNLFKTFMESYAVVDHKIRRKMEEMLRTWKDPVPGSIDTRPVFSHELVRPIENALMKARAALMLQQGTLPGRPRSAVAPHRDTPTPPGMRGPSGPTGAYSGQPFPQLNGGRPAEPAAGGFVYPSPQQVSRRPVDTGRLSVYHQDQPSQYPLQATAQAGVAGPASFQAGLTGPFGSTGLAVPAGISVEPLSNDIQNLIVAMRAEFSHNPHDASVQNRLRALLDLQTVVQRLSLPPDQLELIKNKVTELAAVTMLGPSSAQIVPRALAAPPLHAAPVAPSPAATAARAPGAVTLDTLLGPGALAALIARQSTTGQNSTPQTPYAQKAVRSPPPAPAEGPRPPSQGAAGLLDKLRQAGMLPPAAATNAGAGSAAGAPPPQAMLPPNIANLLSSSKAQPGPGPCTALVDLDPASLKQQYVAGSRQDVASRD